MQQVTPPFCVGTALSMTNRERPAYGLHPLSLRRLGLGTSGRLVAGQRRQFAVDGAAENGRRTGRQPAKLQEIAPGDPPS